MRVTAEMRWFWLGQCPPDLESWFFKSSPEPEEDSHGAMNMCGPRTGRELGIKKKGVQSWR